MTTPSKADYNISPSCVDPSDTKADGADIANVLSNHHLDYLQERAIDIQIALSAGVRTLQPEEAGRALGWSRPAPCTGLGIPYIRDRRPLWRIRLDDAQGWITESRVGVRPWLPSSTVLESAGLASNTLDREDSPICVTEAPTKAMALLSAGKPAIGMAGATAGIHDADATSSPPRTHPELRQRVVLARRPIILVPDAGVAENPAVADGTALAATALHTEGADVWIARLPYAGDDMGPDDYIATYGREAFEQVLAGALPADPIRWPKLCYQENKDPHDLLADLVIGAIIRRTERCTRRKLEDELNVPTETVSRVAQSMQDALGGRESGSRRVKANSLSTFEPKPLSWLWKGYIPRGELTMLDGDPGVGKSSLTADLAARVSTGSNMPDESPGVEPAGVLLASVEDDPHRVLRPRADAAGADVERVSLLGVNAGNHSEGNIVLPQDVDQLEDVINEKEAALVVIDPFVAHLDPSTDTHRDAAVRQALAPLDRVARRTGAAIVLVRHLAKTTGRAAIYRGGGSIGMAGGPRSVLLVGRHPDDTEGVAILTSVKCNVHRRPPSLRFEIMSTYVATATEQMEVGTIQWLGTSTIDADDLAAAMDRRGQDSNTDGGQEADVVGAVSELIDDVGRWEGRATDLLGVLRSRDSVEFEGSRITQYREPQHRWPQDGSALSRALRDRVNELKQAGVEMCVDRNASTRRLVLARSRDMDRDTTCAARRHNGHGTASSETADLNRQLQNRNSS